jgi:SPP1 family predicted phage head-tail adaptor
MPAIGDLCYRVTIQRPAVSQDVSGQPVTSWVEYGRRWAAMRSMSGRELAFAKQAQATATWVVTVRYDAEILPTWRCVYGDRILEIESVVDTSGDMQYMDLNCAEVIAQ